LIGLACAPKTDDTGSGWYSPGILDGAIREALEDAFGAPGAGLPIKPGDSVLVKPNWVHHRNDTGGVECLYTHGEFVLSVLREVMKCSPSRIVVGDAPIQGCHWKSVVPESFVKAMESIDRDGILQIADFRRTIMHGDSLRAGTSPESRPDRDFILFDLGKESLLEPVSSPPGRFRVTMYNPDHLARRHSAGVHQYLIAREALEADVIINLPKLKTHRKAGMTGALKNLVGINGNKEFLPHHRTGGSRDGGDCYPGRSVLKRLAETMIDKANRRIGRASFSLWLFAADVLLHGSRLLTGDIEIEGGWSGNDTVWRTVLDVNRIAMYGRVDGSMAESPGRRIVSLTDALICGQNNGPLQPRPLPMGCVTYSDSSVDADRLNSRLLGFDPCLIPMLRHASSGFRWPLPAFASDEEISEKVRSLSGPAKGLYARPASGWECLAGTFEKQRDDSQAVSSESTTAFTR